MFYYRLCLGFLFTATISVAIGLAQELPPKLPEALQPWEGWVLWDHTQRNSPTPYHTPNEPMTVWPSELALQVSEAGGDWKLAFTGFAKAWVALPGDQDVWPESVLLDDEPIAVIERDGVPSVSVPSGKHTLRGKFVWKSMPQRIAVPPSMGIVRLEANGTNVPAPNWDDEGFVWLQRVQAMDEAQDQLILQTYRVIEDGLPMWLRTQLDISVSGKSREEEIGYVLPEGWQLSLVSSPIPVALDEQGRMKVQVRAGNWQVRIDAFRNSDLKELRYAEGIQPASATELIAVQTRPELRTAELLGTLPIDVEMTTFPAEWRRLPVYEWTTTNPLTWREKTRGMGMQHADQLKIQRRLWLDEDGKGITFQDQIQGQPKQIARLDVAENHELAVVRLNGVRQLITENPVTGAQGIELRTTNPSLEAIGRTKRSSSMLAGGWQSDTDGLNLAIVLPPGWRMFALFGADRVEGDWITAWTLLDLFLLMIFAIALYRLWGLWAGLIALVAFGLSYHEPGAPRLTWLFLLIPVAILHVVKEGKIVGWLQTWRYLAFGLLLLNFIPFAATHIQNALYPQLERVGVPYDSRAMFGLGDATYNQSASVMDYPISSESRFERSESLALEEPARKQINAKTALQSNNMLFDSSTSIQTGIAKPEWRGNEVLCYWDGPVSSDQTIKPIFISSQLHRFLSVVRLALLGLLIYLFVRAKPGSLVWPRRVSTKAVASSAIVLLVCIMPTTCYGQIPDTATLELLRERLLKASDAYPKAAEIPVMEVTIQSNKLSIQAEINAAIDTAIPLPGRIPVWSPLNVTVDNESALVCRRGDGYVWVLVEKGVHQLTAEGLIDDSSEWELAMELLPRRLNVNAPEWKVTGLPESGHPEGQVFFSKIEQQVEGNATYDQKNFRSIVVIERQLEAGLVWKVHNRVRRLSAQGKAISLKVPLLKNERVVTSQVIDDQGQIEVNLGSEEGEFAWESELAIQETIDLEAISSTQAIEQWSLLSSPVWNVSFDGIQPIYELGQGDLVPTWHPWPGEKASLRFRRPQAAPGKTLTIQSVNHELSLGNRQRTSRVSLKVESSVGGEFPLDLPPAAVVTKIALNDRQLPVRREGDRYLISLQPGSQSIVVDWEIDKALESMEKLPAIKLPADAANIASSMHVPESRWILWANGPMRGPAVRFWVILIAAAIFAFAVSRHPSSPLNRIEWMLLAVGLTQVHVAAAIFVVGWLFAIGWRRKTSPASMNRFVFNTLQLSLAFGTFLSIIILIVAVGEGLLGSPEMFIAGNGSYFNYLKWFEPLSGPQLSQPSVVSVSVWYYRLLMLAWALWLANALLRWLKNGWLAFTHETAWR